MGKSKKIEQMNAYYAARAPWHDEYMSYTGNDAMETLLASVIADVEPLLSGLRVLEIACGTGNWTQVLAKRAASVTATDVNQSALDIAQTKDYFDAAVTFIAADAYALGTIEGVFEVAFAADFFSHIPKTARPGFLSGLHTKLTPGGRVVFVDMQLQPHDFEGTWYIDDDGNRVQHRRLPDGKEFQVVKNFPTEAEFRDLLGDAAEDIYYLEYADLQRWLVTYITR